MPQRGSLDLPNVRSTGPMLGCKHETRTSNGKCLRVLPENSIHTAKPCGLEFHISTHIAKTLKKQLAVDATPIDCPGMTKPGAIVTVSVNSVPENFPDP